MDLRQGARSTVNLVEVDGILCVEKRYNERNDPPIVKLGRERRFYDYYDGLEIIPKLVSWEKPDRIVVTYFNGDRLIDLIKGEADGLDIEAISRDYGEKVHTFFEWPLAQSSEKMDEATRTIESVIERVQVAVGADKRYQIAEIEASVDGLNQLLDGDGYWAASMMCKYDGSAGNMLVKDNGITCIIDFDTAYMGTRLTFLGSVLKDCLHLHWPSVRAGLVDNGSRMPGADLLACAAHFNVWQVYLASFRDGKFGWPVEMVRSRILELIKQANES